MSKRVDLNDLYFYKGRFRTDEGLKRALIKDGTVNVSPYRAYYCIEELSEYSWDRQTIKELAIDRYLATEEEFNKWIKEAIDNGECEVTHTRWYHCDANDGLGTRDWWDTREAVESDFDCWNPKYPDDFIERSEITWESYADTLSEEEFKKFEKLPEDKQMRTAMRWRINIYKKAKEELICVN